MPNCKKKKGNQTGTIFDRWDMFASPVPAFNIEE